MIDYPQFDVCNLRSWWNLSKTQTVHYQQASASTECCNLFFSFHCIGVES